MEALLQAVDENACKKDFDAVWNDKWNHAHAQNCGEADGTGGLGVDKHEPEGAKEIANDQANEHLHHVAKAHFCEGFFGGPHEEGGKEETNNIAAGWPKEDADAAAKAGEDGQSEGPKENVDQHREGTAFAAEESYGCKDGEGLHGEGHCGWNGDPGAHRDEGGKEPYVDQILCSER